MESRHRVSPRARNLLHFRQLAGVARCEVQERQPVEVFRLLICFFDDLDIFRISHECTTTISEDGWMADLVVALLESLLRQPVRNGMTLA